MSARGMPRAEEIVEPGEDIVAADDPDAELPARPSRRPTSAMASAQASGFTPPAFVVTRIPLETTDGRMRSISGTTSRA